MNKDFNIIFEKIDQQARVEALAQQGVVVLSGENIVELDELDELRRIAAEIADPEPLYFTTA
jgi:hypothetical protein